MSAQYDQLFQEVGKEYGVDPMILKGIASVESNFNPKAVGPKTRSGQAQGMMQFIPAMQKPYGITDPFNPEQSVTGAARMMSDLLKRYKGDVGKALEAYNGGPRLVGKSTQTRNYAEKVQRKAQLFAKNTPKPSIEVAGTPTQAPSALLRTQEAAQATPKFNVGAKTVAQGPSLDGMGEDYKAALALSYLTEDDTDGLTVTERAEQMLADQEEADSIRGDALSQIFTMPGEEEAEVNPFSVYAAVQNPQPKQQFADGGFVFGGTSLAGMPNVNLAPVAHLTPEIREILESLEPLNQKYEQELSAYEDKFKQYSDTINAYNEFVPKYNEGRQTAYDNWIKEVDAYNAAVDSLQKKADTANQYIDYYNKYLAEKPDSPDFNTWVTNLSKLTAYKRKQQMPVGAQRPDGFYDNYLVLDPYPTGTPEDWAKSIPTAPAEFKYAEAPAAPNVTAPEAPKLGYDPKVYEEKLAPFKRAQEDVEKYGKQRQLALEVVANPDAYNLAGFGMKDGGEVSAMDRVRSFLQAMDITPLDALYAAGRTGAASALALMPSDLNEGEDEQLARYRAIAERERSTAQPPMAGRAEGSPPFGESVDPMFSGIDTEGAPVSPVDTAVSQYISNQSKLFTDPQAWGQKFLENVEQYHGKPLRENPEEYLMGQLGPGAIPGVGILGAIKPRGGIMELGMQNNRMGGVTDPNVPVPVDTVAKAALLSQKDGMGNPLSQDHIDDIINFVEKKYGDYLTKEFGTENDPLRKAIISGRMYKEDIKDPDTGKWRKEQKITKNLSPVFARDSQLYATVDEIQDLVLAKKFAETNPEEFAQLASNPENKLYGYSEDSLQGSIDYKTNAANMYYDLLTNIHPVVYMSDKALGKVDEVDFRDVVKSFTKFPTIDAATTARALDLKQFPGITDEGIAAAKRMADSLVKSAKLMEAEGADRPLETLLSNMYIQRVHNPKNISFEAGQKAVDNEIVFRLDESRPMLGSLNPDEIVKTLSLVDRNKLKNMSFGQAMVDGLKKIESTRNYNEVLINTKAGRSVPREKLFMFTTPMQQIGSGKFGRQWVKLDDTRQAEVEGNLMNHSSGGYNRDDGYNLGGKKAFDEGAAKLFSLRSMETGKPSVTIEYGRDINTKSRYGQPNEDLIRQVRGRFNSAPVSDITEILKFADQNNLSFPKGREEYYEYSKTGEQLADPIKIKWDQLLQAYKQPNFQLVAYKQLGEPTQSWSRVGGDESPSILITSADDPAYKGLEKVTDVKFAKGGMVDKPLYDRAA